MKKILVICGPTALGKTGLALSLAKRFKGEVVSFDSRQVFKEMDIGTGKDLPKGARFYKRGNLPGYYLVKGVRLWGYDLVSPKREFSVFLFLKYSNKIIADVFKRKKMVILTGGTGLYLKALVNGIENVKVPKDEMLRKSLEGESIENLYEKLALLDPIKAGSMNLSDRKNKRRLVRAIEIAQWGIKNKTQTSEKKKTLGLNGLKFSILFIGLTADIKEIEERIIKRVDLRIKQGFEREVEKLLLKGVIANDQSMASLGYQQWFDYLENKVSRKEAIELWVKAEKGYAKRQITWFKKDKRIEWFDVTQSGYEDKIVKKVKRWYKD